jgi:hypothetical protein
MSYEDVSILLAKISGVLDDEILYDLQININWETIANIYDIVEDIGEYNGGYFYPYAIDIIVKNIFNKDKFLFKEVFIYIANRYDFQIIEELFDEYDYLFKDYSRDIAFENDMDANNLNMFISFNSNNSEEAKKIQDFFKKGNVNCFLSETDMEISDEYKRKTYNEILNADIFIYLLSVNSKSSDWCDQEMGMAYMKYKFNKSQIFVVSHDGMMPYGFLSSFNAGFTYDSNYLFNVARKIDEKFDSSLFPTIKKAYDDLIDLKIKELSSAKTFKSAEHALLFINHRSHLLNETQLRRICEAALRNNQIYGGFICKEPLEDILSSHKEDIDDELYHEVLNKINPIK